MRIVRSAKGKAVAVQTLSDPSIQDEYEQLLLSLVDGYRKHDKYKIYLINPISPLKDPCPPDTGCIYIPTKSSLHRYNEDTQEIELLYAFPSQELVQVRINTITGAVSQWMDIPSWLPDSPSDLAYWLGYNEDPIPEGYVHYPDEVVYDGINVKMVGKNQILYINCPLGWRPMNHESLSSVIKSGFLSPAFLDEISMARNLLYGRV